ncbi:hypothetical protein CsSME_00015455 [Camellia sinensis var. sinensis]
MQIQYHPGKANSVADALSRKLSSSSILEPLVDLRPCLDHISRDVTLHPSDLVLEWYDLGRGVAHLGQDVAQLSQVLSFLAGVTNKKALRPRRDADVFWVHCRHSAFGNLG